MIEIRNLSKHFGPLTAVDDITLSVAKGEVLGFLGPNGAGKSTTMKMITGFLTPSSGTAVVCGHDILTAPIEVKKRIGYLPEGAPLYGDMTPRGFLRFIAAVRNLPKAGREARIAEVVGQVHLEGVMNQRIDTLSKGYKRRVGIAQAILHDPEVLILDEPTDGLDPNQKHEVRALIGEMSKDKCIVLSTHILEEVPAVCSRAVIIDNGKLVFDGEPLEMQKLSPRHNAISLKVREGSVGDIQALRSIENVQLVEKCESEDGFESFLIYPTEGAAILGALSRIAHEKNWEVDHLSVEDGRLDEVFRKLTSGNA
jgi:ABC-2 type transport system ATP-binding protein